MATLRQVEAELAKQRQMIDGLVARVTQHEARASLAEDLPPAVERSGLEAPIELMAGMKPAPAPASVRPAAPKPPPMPASPPAPAAAPMVSDDLFAQLSAKPAFDPMATQKLPPDSDRTQKLGPESERTQKLPPGSDRTQRLPSGSERTQPVPSGSERTQQLPSGSERTQQLPSGSERTQQLGPETERTQRIDPGTGLPDPEATQRLDDSVWRLEEARRILQGVREK